MIHRNPHSLGAIFIYAGIFVARLIYLVMKFLPTTNKVVLISRANDKTSIDFKMISDEIHRRYKTTKVVILNHKMTSKLSHIGDMLVEMYHLATSKACVVDSYVIAVSILKHKSKLTVVQIWHALGAIKKFGYLTLDKKAGNPSRIAKIMCMHRGYTYVTAPSKAMGEVFEQTFDVQPNQIKVVGSPRIDFLNTKQIMSNARQRIVARYPRLNNGKQTILYAPTFRRGHRLGDNKLDELISEIDFSKYNLVIKQHRLAKRANIKSSNIIYIANQFEAIELLSIADYVITDYSAVAFEAVVTGKPVHFWAYDRQQYANDCGFAVDYDHRMPGCVSSDARDIIASLQNWGEYLPKYESFRDKYLEINDRNSTARIVGLLGL